MDIDWGPIAAGKWVSHDKSTWQFDGTTYAFDAVLIDIKACTSEKMRTQAAKHHCGTGLEGGVDHSAYHAHVEHLRTKGLEDHVAVLETIATGSTWPHARRREAGYPVAGVVPKVQRSTGG